MAPRHGTHRGIGGRKQRGGGKQGDHECTGSVCHDEQWCGLTCFQTEMFAVKMQTMLYITLAYKLMRRRYFGYWCTFSILVWHLQGWLLQMLLGELGHLMP
jgi:hypothetical protein